MAHQKFDKMSNVYHVVYTIQSINTNVIQMHFYWKMLITKFNCRLNVKIKRMQFLIAMRNCTMTRCPSENVMPSQSKYENEYCTNAFLFLLKNFNQTFITGRDQNTLMKLSVISHCIEGAMRNYTTKMQNGDGMS